LRASVPVGASAAATAVASEPIWAIGTGKTPSSAEIAEMHGHIRATLTGHLGGEGSGLRILYGGSVKPGNAREILALPEVGGALVGGASLKAADFQAIFAAASIGA
jgi:triosephosphate isomerase (TIM)